MIGSFLYLTASRPNTTGFRGHKVFGLVDLQQSLKGEKRHRLSYLPSQNAAS